MTRKHDDSASKTPKPSGDAPVEPTEGASDASVKAASELAAATAQAQQLRQKVLELTADLDNQAKRFARERQVVREEIVTRMAREMIDVLDNLDLVVNSLKEGDLQSPLGQGARLTRDLFLEKLKAVGVEPIDSLGRPFDPAWHEALFETESADQAAGTVLSELTKGYRLGNKLVRASKVEVAKEPAASSTIEPGTEPDADAAAGGP